MSEEIVSHGAGSRRSIRSNHSITYMNISKQLPKLQNSNKQDTSFNSIMHSSGYANSNRRALSRRQDIRDMEIQAPVRDHTFDYVSR